MALYPAADMSEGVVALWISGEAAAERAAELVAGLGFPVAAAMNVRFAPAERLRGSIAPPADKSISHRAAIIGAMASEPVPIANYLHAADTDSTLAAVAELGAIVERATARADPRVRSAQRPAAGGADRRRQRRHPDAAAAGLARLPARTPASPSTATTRSAAARWTGSPSRWGGWARGSRPGTAATPRSPSTARRCEGVRYELPVASAQVKSCVLLAGLGTDGTTVIEPVASRDHTERMLLSAGASLIRDGSPESGYAIEVGRADELELEPVTVPGDMSSAAFLIAAGVIVPRLAAGARGGRGQLDPRRLSADRPADGRASWSATASTPGSLSAEEPVCDLDVSNGPIEATEVTAERGAAGHRRATAGGAAGLLRRGRDGRAGRRRAAGQGVRPHRHRGRRTARPGGEHRGATTTGSRSAAPAACAAAGWMPTAITGWRCSARSPAWPPRRAWRWWAWRRPTSPIRGFADDLAALSA